MTQHTPVRDVPPFKTCRICEEELPAESFRPDPRMKSGLYSYCRPCESKKAQQWHRDNPDKRAIIEARRKPRTYEQRRDAVLRREYGITLEQYNELLSAQGGRCAICRADAPGRGKTFVVDHCHASGRVRGLLCNGCNVGLGHFRDDPESLAAAILYLTV